MTCYFVVETLLRKGGSAECEGARAGGERAHQTVVRCHVRCVLL